MLGPPDDGLRSPHRRLHHAKPLHCTSPPRCCPHSCLVRIHHAPSPSRSRLRTSEYFQNRHRKPSVASPGLHALPPALCIVPASKLNTHTPIASPPDAQIRKPGQSRAQRVCRSSQSLVRKQPTKSLSPRKPRKNHHPMRLREKNAIKASLHHPCLLAHLAYPSCPFPAAALAPAET